MYTKIEEEVMEWIKVRGACEHNLKNIDVDIPKNKLVVFTGLSGSGKSTLALDTIYAEGQRRYLESVSTYARQFLGDLKKPDVESIVGLSPAIAIEQKSVGHNPRSTVGTITEIYDYLRVLYARLGKAYCPNCSTPLESSTVDEIIEKIYKNFDEQARLFIFSPIAREKKGEFKKEIEAMKLSGFKMAEIDGKLIELEEVQSLPKTVRHNINLLIDRLKLKKENFQRLYEAIELALREGDGFVTVINTDDNNKYLKTLTFSEVLACPNCGFSFPEITPKLFSFNSPYGACPECHGLGFKMEIDPAYILDVNKTLSEGAVAAMGTDTYMVDSIRQMITFFGADPEKKIKDLPPEIITYILYGTDQPISFKYENSNGSHNFKRSFEGIINWFERRYRETESQDVREWIENNIMVQKTCQSCEGKRLRKEALSVLIGGKSIYELTDLPMGSALEFIEKLELTDFEKQIGSELLGEVRKRIGFLVDVGLNYISLNRAANTLSGGESQRVRLATQIGSGLTGVTYVLDEPTIGLHQRDNDRLIETLRKLRDLGNTVIVVEHDEDVIRAADYVVDLGPNAGINGGRLVYQGSVDGLIKNPHDSLTGRYLAKIEKIEIFNKKRVEKNRYIKLTGAKHNNLKNVDLEVPLGKFVVVTGVSGSGKSSLIMDTLFPILQNHLYRSKNKPGEYRTIEGLDCVDNVISIDQSPIGRTPRSNPATYIGVFDLIRDLFASSPEAKMRGYDKSRFSFNVKGGRCEACAGHGVIKIEMQFLQDVYVTCDVCKGTRYNKETLRVMYKGKSIAEVLEMSVDEGADFFKNVVSINRSIQMLKDVGLGYIKLGQPATTLSGGEAQRIKLTAELKKRDTGNTVYILDEPTTGLHFEDVKKLIGVLNLLTEKGNTVVVIEHNLDVIKNADYIIDLGPEGGENGGMIVAQGSVEDIIKSNSYTGQYLKKIFQVQASKSHCIEA